MNESTSRLYFIYIPSIIIASSTIMQFLLLTLAKLKP